MRAWRLLCLPILAWVLVLTAHPRLQGLNAAALFDDTTLHEVRLFINSRDYVKLREGYLTNTYYPADLLWRNVRVRNVAVRSRGSGSRNPIKLGLRVDFNRYTKGQQFLGLSSLVLDNVWQDPSFLREGLAMATFRRMGQPAPRESYCRLYINNVYEGVYAVVEPIDGAFAARAFSDPGGYLYEYQWVSPYYGEDLGDSYEPYKARFQPQTHELEPDATLYGPVRELFREINGPDDAVWRERVDARIDLAQFVAMNAIEAYLAENDALLGYAGWNNFYMYRGAGSSRFRILAWDRDFAFTFIDSSVMRSINEFVLISRALGQDDLRAQYLDLLEATARATAEEDWLLSEIDRRVALISDSVLADPRKQYSNDEFAANIEFLRTFAARRPGLVLNEVAALRQAFPPVGLGIDRPGRRIRKGPFAAPCLSGGCIGIDPLRLVR